MSKNIETFVRILLTPLALLVVLLMALGVQLVRLYEWVWDGWS